jgi:AraC-like DNA-binding protein
MILFIKNMVCDRCRMVVQQTLDSLGYHPTRVELGEVEIEEILTGTQLDELRERLRAHQFELLDDRRHQTVERIKTAVIELIHRQPERLRRTNPSTYLAEALARDYKYLSGLFSEVEGLTIEQYVIQQKIERVKELLAYDELTLSQIADALHYSSVQHLSGQFKKVTGLTPSAFKRLKAPGRRALDQIGTHGATYRRGAFTPGPSDSSN